MKLARILKNDIKQLKAEKVDLQELMTLGNGEAKYFYFWDNQGNFLEAAWSIWDQEDEIIPK